jgi:RNA polymerase sigma factor (sigma-70 family)
MSDASDAELMLEVREGRSGALAELFERHHESLYRFCLRMVGDRHAAEDLVQDVFMKMLKYRKSFGGDSGFTSWMLRIARNASVDFLRYTSSRRRVEIHTDQEAVETTTTEAVASEQQRAALVRQALAALPRRHREVLVLSRFEFKSYDEIAHVLGCSVGAVKVRAHRAMKQLRDIYQSLAPETIS